MACSMHLFLLFYFPNELSAEWGSSANQIAWMDTLSFFGAFVGWIPGRLASNFFGRRPTLLFSTLVVSCLSFYSAYARNFTELCVFRILLGIAIGMSGPAASSLVMELSPPSTRKRLSIALVGGAASVGRILLALLAFALESGLAYEHTATWRAVVVLCSFLSLAALILAVYSLAESPEWMLANGMPDQARLAADTLFLDNGRPAAAGRRLAAPATPAACGGDVWASLRHVLDDISNLSQVCIYMYIIFIYTNNYNNKIYITMVISSPRSIYMLKGPGAHLRAALSPRRGARRLPSSAARARARRTRRLRSDARARAGGG